MSLFRTENSVKTADQKASSHIHPFQHIKWVLTLCSREVICGKIIRWEEEMLIFAPAPHHQSPCQGCCNIQEHEFFLNYCSRMHTLTKKVHTIMWPWVTCQCFVLDKHFLLWGLLLSSPPEKAISPTIKQIFSAFFFFFSFPFSVILDSQIMCPCA